MNKKEIISIFEESKAILKGHFILSSGLHSDTYLQCARVLMNHKVSNQLCSALANKIEDKFGKNAFDLIVSPAMGGVVVGYEMGRHLELNSIFCERQNGKFAIRRGFEIKKDQKILIIEDVVTTGKSSLEAIECVKSFGGNVIAEACLINRSNEQNPINVPLVSLLKLDVNVFDKNNVPEHLKETQAIKPGSRHLNK